APKHPSTAGWIPKSRREYHDEVAPVARMTTMSSNRRSYVNIKVFRLIGPIVQG
ncbi:MAG: hypothetical protein EZS28_047719, partial [Streblomastix strix]